MDFLLICIRDGYYVIVTDNVYLRDYLDVKKTVNLQSVLPLHLQKIPYVENTVKFPGHYIIGASIDHFQLAGSTATLSMVLDVSSHQLLDLVDFRLSYPVAQNIQSPSCAHGT